MMSFSTCQCNRPRENSGWVPEREHTAPNGKWKLLDVRWQVCELIVAQEAGVHTGVRADQRAGSGLGRG